MKFTNTYKFKLTSFFILLIFLPVVIGNFVTYRLINNAMIQDVYDNNIILVAGMESTINQTLNSVENSIISAALSDTLKTLDVDNMDSILQGIVATQESISMLYVMDETGMQIYKTEGEVGDRSDREYFQQAIQGNFVYSDRIVSRTTGLPIVVYAVPIKDDDNNIVGVLGGNIELALLNNLINTENMHVGSYAFIVDHNGVLISHPDEQLIIEQTDVSYLEPVADVLNKNNDIGEYTFNGEDKLAAYRYMEKTNWGLVVQMPRAIALEHVNEISLILAIIGIVLLMFIFVAIYVISKSVTKPLVHIQTLMAKAKHGELQLQFDEKYLSRQDEFGLVNKDFKEMLENIGNLIRSSKKISNEVNEASTVLTDMSERTRVLSDEIAHSSEEIAKGAIEQATSAERSVDLTKAFENHFIDLSNRSKEVSNVVKDVAAINQSSHKKIDELNKATEDSSAITKRIEHAINELDAKSTTIVTILETITSISQQTNLLALNASIEAARAGEHGRGFSVVAEEIRKLAEGSNEAAGEIGQIINNIQSEVRVTVGLMEEVSTVSDKQKMSVEQVGETFRIIDQSVLSIEENVNQIDDAVQAFKEENKVIVDSITSISSVSEETAAAAQEVSSSVEEQLTAVESVDLEIKQLNELTKQLTREIDVFKV